MDPHTLYHDHWIPMARGDPDAALDMAQRTAELHRLYKGKGDQTVLSSFRGLSHQSHDYKMAERVTQAVGQSALDRVMPADSCGSLPGCDPCVHATGLELILRRCFHALYAL